MGNMYAQQMLGDLAEFDWEDPFFGEEDIGDFWDGGGSGVGDLGGGDYDYTDPDTGDYYYYGAAGDVTVYGADGEIDYYGPDGQFESDSPDGTVSTYNVDGSVTVIDPSGESYYEDANGNWTFSDANGFSCSGDANGSGCCDDGSCWGDWASAPSSPRNANNKANQTKQAAASGGGAGAGGGGAKPPGAQPATQPKPPTTGLNPLAQPRGAVGQGANMWIWIAIVGVGIVALSNR